MTGELIVFVTCPAALADKLARPLVGEGLAACVNIIGPITSVFSWEGKVCQESEELLIIKSHRRCWEKLKARVVELHSYTTPEIVALPIEDGYKPYMHWLNVVLQGEAHDA
ncbi:MAG: divalent-cation tolerance protein CutA [Candidatus Melainabacteria bacterium]|nr:divalent-cation tolerance protein CutA [Candidatus Melainabacteria bacterium]